MKSLRFLAVLPFIVLTSFSAWAAPIQRIISPGGVEAWLIEDGTLPIIALSLGFKDGSTRDPAGKEGLAAMTADLLSEGAGKLESFAFRTQLENHAIDLSFSAKRDSFEGSLLTTSDNRDKAFNMLRLALTAPRFDSEPIERIRVQMLTNLKMTENDPSTLAARRLDEVLFAGHPYSRPVLGTPQSIKSIKVKDLRTFVAGLGRDQLKVAVAGDITAEELGRRLDEIFSELPNVGAKTNVPDILPKAEGTIVVPLDVPQSVAQFAQIGIDKDDPDFYPALTVNYTFGSAGLTSRLMTEVREKRGLAYNVFTSLSQLAHAPLLIGSVATGNARMGESLKVIRSEWARMAEDGPTAEELEDAKTYLIGSWPLRFSSTPRIAGILLAMQLDGYPIDHLETRNDKIRAVTLPQAKIAAKRLFSSRDITVVVAGKPEGIDKTP